MAKEPIQMNLRVLVVEDEALIVLLLEDMIMELGAVMVGPFFSVATALAAAQQDDFDVALIDMNLGAERADAVAAALAARGIPFAVASGGSAEAYTLGQAAVLQKPFGLNDVAEVLQRLSAAQRAQRK